MGKLPVLVFMGILVILKLVITGICLSIGFRLGAKVYDHIEEKRKKKETISEPVTQGVAA